MLLKGKGLLCFPLCLFLIILISACGESPHSSSETGSIAFSIEWKDAPVSETESGTIRAASLDCEAAGVTTVRFDVYDSSGTYLTGASWPCSYHQGTVSGVPAGSNRRLVVLGEDSVGNVLYQGEKTGITVTAGQTTNVGTIQVAPFSPTTTTTTTTTTSTTTTITTSTTSTTTTTLPSLPPAPTNVSTSPGNEKITIFWESVSGATSYNLYWAIYSGVSKTNYEGVISDVTSPYTHTGLINGTTYYYVVTAENSYGESDESNEVSATPFAPTTLPDTGQTQSYTDIFGEDSDYTINPPSYTDNGDGTVTDNVTSLMWQQEDEDTTCTWNEACTYCDSLTLAGYSDWRLPSKKELIRTVDYGTYNSAIDETYFPGTNESDYWSSTVAEENSDMVWSVHFGSGYADYDYKSNDFYVRCVRGKRGSFGIFLDNGDGTVTDRTTELMWQQGEAGSMNWEDAITYCEGLSLAGYSDWRLPNIKELESITDDSLYEPAIDTNYFPDVYVSSYWSSTTRVSDPYKAWYVLFTGGMVSVRQSDKSDIFCVRCVRAGQ